MLQRAHAIVHERSEEGERKYGPFGESMEKTAAMASIMCNKELTAEDCMKVFVAQKLVRESYAHKEDNILDGCAYLAALNEYSNDKENPQAVAKTG